MTVAISEQLLRRMWPHGDAKVPGLVAGIAASSTSVFARNGITTWLQVAHIMSQMSHECTAGNEVVESLNYRADQLRKQWPSHFTAAQALRMARNPKAIADQAYNGRMGNRVGSDDGWKFRGRGGPQTTGQEGYAKLSTKTGLDLLGNPDLELDPMNFLECMVADFIICGCLPYCTPKSGLPDGDIRAVTHHLNGGYIGLAQRQAWFAKWKAALRAPAPVAAPVALPDDADSSPTDVEAAEPYDAPVDDGILRYGSDGYEVKALQGQLVDLGYQVGSVDGDFGGGTRAAVLAFQADNGLPTTGEVDPATKSQLKTAPPKPISEKRASATVDDLRAGGSGTVQAADHLTWWGKAMAFTGLAGAGSHGAQKVGLLDTVKDTTDQVSQFRGVFDQVHDVAGWVVSTATTYWWVVLAAIGFFGIKFGGDIIKRRLEDHRSASNLRQ
ncbi:MAG: hypothetical protein JWP25_7267 [Bradyrhizobium sp.]|nr:hypothetical protein [Bradyrhizobium sp.]